MTSQLNLKTLKCIRQHDLTGKDEPEIWINGRKYFATVLDKEGHVNVPAADSAIQFTDQVKVELFESSGSADHVDRKQIGTAYKVTESNPPPSPMDFKTSGSHYTLSFSVSPVVTAGATAGR
jgi:hypothetical protein